MGNILVMTDLLAFVISLLPQAFQPSVPDPGNNRYN